jgi:serine/threonine-protein phosphatase 2B catalytic subunit
MTSKDKSRDAASSAEPKYSTTERNCKTVPEPPTHRLDIKDLFSNPSNPKDKPNLEVLKQHIILEGRLTEEAALRIIETGKNIYFLVYLSTEIVFTLFNYSV